MRQVTNKELGDLLSSARTKWNGRMYAERYASYFAPLREQPINLLEIGIGGYDDPKVGGESLWAWHQYFPNGQINGIDIFDKSFLQSEQIRTFKGSQDDPGFLRRLIAEAGPFDIIIDDGSHHNQHVVTSFKVLFPALRENGIYAVEDTHFSYLPSRHQWEEVWGGGHTPRLARYGGNLNIYANDTTMGFFKRLSDCANHQDFFHPHYRPNYLDLHIVGVHFYRNQVFVLKGDNSSQGNFFEDNSLRPEWFEPMGVNSADELDMEFPPIDDPSELCGDAEDHY